MEKSLGLFSFRYLIGGQMNNVCQVFKDSAAYVQKWHEKQPAVKEESLTDWLLYDISQKSSLITYQAYTRHQEAKYTGADWEWEWWFLTNSGGLKLRVQAKKAHSGKSNLYSGIAHSNKYGLQNEMLRNAAAANSAMALYAFFSDAAAPNLCQSGLLKQGVYLASANRVFNKFLASGPKPVSAGDVLAISMPLPCFACCAQLTSPIDVFKEMFPDEFGDKDLSDVVGFHKQLPAFIEQFVAVGDIDQSRYSDQRPEQIEEAVEGLLVVDLREQTTRRRINISNRS
ncbi:MAG: hypothetical protein HHJ16_02010 [Polaromonas sp.]|uniref:DUF6615 family protein n=1 Tax=Polaromonas sp. TaxID=1869339 RepID=UPI0017CE0292|nr:DUF6615 family protein [Polaromonas sp.]NMM09036.1 hypothetical protein [Polaromonas sp.]